MAQDVSEFGEKLTRAQIDKQRLMDRIVLTVLGNSIPLTPVLTGTLKRSETTRVEGNGDRGYVGSNVDYARFVHDGARGKPGTPFFELGMAASRGTIDALMKDEGDRFFSKLL